MPKAPASRKPMELSRRRAAQRAPPGLCGAFQDLRSAKRTCARSPRNRLKCLEFQNMRPPIRLGAPNVFWLGPCDHWPKRVMFERSKAPGARPGGRLLAFFFGARPQRPSASGAEPPFGSFNADRATEERLAGGRKHGRRPSPSAPTASGAPSAKPERRHTPPARKRNSQNRPAPSAGRPPNQSQLRRES